MPYTSKMIDLKKYTLLDEMRKGIFEYIAKSPINENDRNNDNNFFLKRTIWREDIHIGEFLAGIIGNKCGFKICKTELYKQPLSKSGLYDVGILSYVSKADGDRLVCSNIIIQNYLKSQGIKTNTKYKIDVDTILNSFFYIVSKAQRPYQEFLNLKQDFIDMLVFDIKFMNPDRTLENWFIRKNMKTGEIDLYPMFDNEMILGFNEDVPKKEFSEEEIEFKNIKIGSAILIPTDYKEDKEETQYDEMLKYLLKRFPEQTRQALKKTEKISYNDLLDILDKIEDIDELRKKQVAKLYKKRDEKVKEICKEYEKNDSIKYYN